MGDLRKYFKNIYQIALMVIFFLKKIKIASDDLYSELR